MGRGATVVAQRPDDVEDGVDTVAEGVPREDDLASPTGPVLAVLTVRSFDDDTRQLLLLGIQRIAEAQAASAGLPSARSISPSLRRDAAA